MTDKTASDGYLDTINEFIDLVNESIRLVEKNKIRYESDEGMKYYLGKIIALRAIHDQIKGII